MHCWSLTQLYSSGMRRSNEAVKLQGVLLWRQKFRGKAFVWVLISVFHACFSALAKYRTPKPLEKERKWRPRKNKPLVVMQEILLNQAHSAGAIATLPEDHSCKKWVTPGLECNIGFTLLTRDRNGSVWQSGKPCLFLQSCIKIHITRKSKQQSQQTKDFPQETESLILWEPVTPAALGAENVALFWALTQKKGNQGCISLFQHNRLQQLQLGLTNCKSTCREAKYINPPSESGTFVSQKIHQTLCKHKVLCVVQAAEVEEPPWVNTGQTRLSVFSSKSYLERIMTPAAALATKCAQTS